METAYDWVSVAIFAGLAIVFLQRSVGERPASDRVVKYLPPALGCALGNYLGNHDQAVAAIAVLIAAVAYIWIVIRPGRGDLIR